MTSKLKMTRGSGNVFADLGFARDEAQNLMLRSELMTRIERFVSTSGLTQQEAAKRLGISQPRLNDLLRGKIDKFSIDALVNMLAAVGMRVTISVKQAS